MDVAPFLVAAALAVVGVGHFVDSVLGGVGMGVGVVEVMGVGDCR